MTNRLKIRELKTTDKNSLFRIYSDKEAMKYRGSKPFDSLEEVDEMLTRTFKKLKSKEEFRYAIEQKENKVLIGTFLIKPITQNECEIGYSLGKKYWGNGYGKELVKGMLIHIKDLPFKKIIATSRKENIASLKLLESIGFKVFPEKEFDGCHFLEYSSSQ
jgi:RimJ/RimL family protein N-acetyltransferase